MVSMRKREREATSRDRAPRSFRVIESKDLASQNVVMVLIKFIIDITMKKKKGKICVCSIESWEENFYANFKISRLRNDIKNWINFEHLFIKEIMH